MKKKMAMAFALMMGITTLTGSITAGAADGEKTTITFWHYMSEDKEGKFVNEAIDEFNNSQDEIFVDA